MRTRRHRGRKASPVWRSRDATCERTRSPAGWPKRSLMRLKSSTSTRQSESRRRTLVRVPQLPLEAFVEVPVIPQPCQGVGQREAHGAQRTDDRALVELDREQRADERHREEGRALPEHDQHQRRRGHQGERHDRPADVRAGEREERAARAHGHDGGDQDQVDGVLGGRGRADAGEHPIGAFSM